MSSEIFGTFFEGPWVTLLSLSVSAISARGGYGEPPLQGTCRSPVHLLETSPQFAGLENSC